MKNLLEIRNSVLFRNFTEEEASAILKCLGATLKSYAKDEAVFLSGDKISDVGVVLSGELRLQREDFDGNIIISEEIVPGETFGAAFVCAEVEKMPINVWSVSKTEILFIDYSRIINRCSSNCAFHNKLTRNILKDMGERLIRLNHKLNIVQKRSMREKLTAYFEDYRGVEGEFTIPFSKTQLAEYIGVDRSAMSRELSKMRDEGVLNFHGAKFTWMSSKRRGWKIDNGVRACCRVGEAE